MGNEYQSLDELLNDCTVRVKTAVGHGTGFFVAPGLILTCAHVVKSAYQQRSSITVYCNFDQKIVPVEQIDQNDMFLDSYPDLALLHVDISNHPCVLLGVGFSAFTDFYSYGFTKDHPDGESTTVKCEGTQEDGGTFLKLKEGQVKPGSSGSPLLNKSTGSVCGMIARTRDSTSDLGGAGIPTTTVFEKFPNLERQNLAFHSRDLCWTNLLEKEMPVKIQNVTTALLYSGPGKISKPPHWVGREELLVRISELLDQSHRVLLTGMGGIGKTSLAQVLVDERLKSGSAPVLWLDAGGERVEVLIETLAERCGNEKIITITNTEAKKLALKDLLDKYGAGLLVVDNVRNIKALNDLLDAVPDKLPVLMTSRMSFDTDDILDVSQLSPNDALELLAAASGVKDWSMDESAKSLCKLFGYHPLALEIAGASMKEMHGRTPAKLLERLESNPIKLSSLRRGEIRPLLDECAENLSETLNTVFLSFGKFPVNGLTPSLLARYLEKNKNDIVDALDALVIRNLVKCRIETDFYYLHDLIFHYVKAISKSNEEIDSENLVNMAINYLTENKNGYELIALDLSNVLAIADDSKPLKLIEIMSWLTLGGYPEPGADSYFENKGNPTAFLERLDKAIRVCRQLDDCPKGSLHYLLGKRGNAYYNTGDYINAIACYEEAISLAPNANRKAVLTSVTGKTYALRGDSQKAQIYFQEAHKIAEPLKDDLLLISIMGQESLAASAVGDFEKIRDIARNQIKIIQRVLFTNPSPLAYKHHFYALLNLGAAEFELAKIGKGSFETALPILQHATQVALGQKNDVLLAYVYDSLAELYHYLHDSKNVMLYFERSVQLWNQLGMDKYARELEARMLPLGYAISHESPSLADQ